MRLSVGTNFDQKLPGELASLPGNPVDTVYGKLSADLVGGGRPTFALPKVDWDTLERHIKTVHSYGIDFNYLLNAACMDNRETTAQFTEKFKDFLERLKKIGVDAVTVTAPLLIRRVRCLWPEVPISLSAFANVQSLQQVRDYVEMGVNEITLPESKNRDFKFLRALQEHSYNCTFRLIATNDCMLNCPLRAQHANFQSHASQSGHVLSGFALDYCMIKCTQMKQAHPERLIQSPWIRPEDMKYYEKLGFQCFKLTERMKRTGAILRTARAYAKRSFDGNLLELLNTRLSEQDFETPDFAMITGQNYAPKGKTALLFRQLFGLQGTVNNRALDGFLEEFDSKQCDVTDCASCGLCQKWARKAVKPADPAAEDGASLGQIVGELENGKFFNQENNAWLPERELFLCELTAEVEGCALEQMRDAIREQALQLARQRKKPVSNEDIARAYLISTPDTYKKYAKLMLRNHGYDPDAFGEV